MAIPDYQSVMLPLLKLTSDRKEHALREIITRLATEFRLTEAEKKQLLPSGKQQVFHNRVGWARTYLTKAGLLTITRRGFCCITDRGIELLNQGISKININILNKYPEFREFKSIRKEKKAVTEDINKTITGTPEEELETVYQGLTINLEEELLQSVKSMSPDRFEQVVIDLLVKMGYGGSHKDAAEAIGGIGDEGVDGVISEDRLGLDRIYIQAKRWNTTNVGRPIVQGFVGALEGKHAQKGILITTSTFSNDARSYIESINSRVILIDGNKLAQLMYEYNLGCNPVNRYEIKKIDTDYFEEDL